MIVESATARRSLRNIRFDADLAVIGGGLAGVCCAITAARGGLKVILIQDRPVLGGNASSEVRLWALGATSHMGNNNRWAREGGVIDEILVENVFRNPEGNPHLFDAVLLDKVTAEANITLLLNTAVYEVDKDEADTIAAVRAFCSQNSTTYDVRAPLFCDASGDGIVGFMAGAVFRMGAESNAEFGEKLAPPEETAELLGHTIYFYSKDVGKPVRFVPPDFALKDITRIPRFGHIDAMGQGCQLWWLEYGGRHDTVHETEEIKWELWKVVYGVWDYVKNSGRFPEAENLTLEWVGTIPGKRESRRFEGDYILTQQDVVEQRRHEDAVAFGGWAIDLHPADGLYSDKPGCTQWHSRGVYQIPYRCIYSRNVRNLLLAGRDISVSHVAFGSTRVMATCAHTAQAAGMAAVLCAERGELPRNLLAPKRMQELQTRLLNAGQYIPHVSREDGRDLALAARIEASSSFTLAALPPSESTGGLGAARAMLIPLPKGRTPKATFYFDAETDAELEFQLRLSEREGNFTPDVVLATRRARVEAGTCRAVTVDFDVHIDRPQYAFYCIMPCPDVRVRLSNVRVTGVVSLTHGANPKVAKSAVQTPPEDSGVDQFEFWLPQRRPEGENLALTLDPLVALFGPENVVSSLHRPTTQPNAWVAAAQDAAPRLTLRWESPVKLGRIELTFDTDSDHAMESVQWGHPNRAMPSCLRSYVIRDQSGNLLASRADNYQTRNVIRITPPVVTDSIVIERMESNGDLPPVIFGVQCYEQ
ncbi:MAG TPA: FAD-dependent oxidoreductase [Chthoniobacteraceae bacterium]|jgi:hypothetical protein|nr:FAD-dependent oxidoreductase [Chthoniobacteraceae bacterium]